MDKLDFLKLARGHAETRGWSFSVFDDVNMQLAKTLAGEDDLEKDEVADRIYAVTNPLQNQGVDELLKTVAIRLGGKIDSGAFTRQEQEILLDFFWAALGEDGIRKVLDDTIKRLGPSEKSLADRLSERHDLTPLP